MKNALARLQRSGALRISEVAAIMGSDIDWKNKSVLIHRSVAWPRKKGLQTEIKNGFKNGDEKTIPLSPDAFAALKELGADNVKGLIFHKHQDLLEYRWIQHSYDSASRQTGIDIRGTHVMRRTGASWILNETGDIDLAKQLLGNTTWTSVAPYAQRE
jgi:integrase